ncbi:MAG: hypothetical protein GY778_23375 [bacterium]|nr:hypothetical protein [bacterium]
MLYVGGSFVTAGGLEVDNVAKWDGGWSDIAGGGLPDLNDQARALTVHDDGSGPALFVGGSFNEVGGQVVFNVAKWDGQSWSALGSGVTELGGTLELEDWLAR